MEGLRVDLFVSLNSVVRCFVGYRGGIGRVILVRL